MVLPLRIAARFLASGKGQTALIVGGIAIAISVQVFVGLLIDSLQAGLVEQTVGNSPQVTVRSAEKNVTISRWEEMVTGIGSLTAVRHVGVSASGNAFVSKSNDSVPVVVRGLNATAIDEVYRMGGAQAVAARTYALFDKASGQSRLLDTRLATLKIGYDATLEMNEDARLENPLGFRVLAYRVDQDAFSSAATPSTPSTGERDAAF